MAPEMNLANKHIFIAGGSRGIGAASAKMLASAGAKVSLTYQANQDAADQVLKNISDEDGQAQAFQMAIEDEGSVTQAVDQAVENFGNLHGMVVSASVFEHCQIEDMSLEFWERVMSINLRGTVWCVKAAAKHMRAHGNAVPSSSTHPLPVNQVAEAVPVLMPSAKPVKSHSPVVWLTNSAQTKSA